MRAELLVIARYCNSKPLGEDEAGTIADHCRLFRSLAAKAEKEMRREHMVKHGNVLQFDHSATTKLGEPAFTSRIRAEAWILMMTADGLRGALARQKPTLPNYLRARSREVALLMPEVEFTINDVIILRIFVRGIQHVAKELRSTLKKTHEAQARRDARAMIDQIVAERPKRRIKCPTLTINNQE
jgi:hypothetical protein